MDKKNHNRSVKKNGSNELSGGEGIFLMDQMNFCGGRGKITMKNRRTCDKLSSEGTGNFVTPDFNPG